MRKYVYDGDNIVAELNADNRTLARYTCSPNRPDDLLSVSFTTHAVSASNGGTAHQRRLCNFTSFSIYYIDAFGVIEETFFTWLMHKLHCHC